jgi:hypothetical protein
MVSRSFVRKLGRLIAVVCPMLVGVSGCPGRDPGAPLTMEDLGDVSGIATYGGRPLVHGALLFFSDKALVGFAAIEKDGSYRTKLVPGEYKVGISTAMEPREVRKWAKEGPPGIMKSDPNGGGPPPDPKKELAGMVEKGKDPPDPYDRLPSLAALREKLDVADRIALDRVNEKYANAQSSNLTIRVSTGDNRRNFDLD